MLGGANPKGISLHIGLNRVDPVHYAGWKGELVACENDARDMETIARSQGLVAQSLLTKAATSTALLGLIEKAARELVEDDFFSLTYSGHGGQINDVNNDEPDGLDETWALYDRELVDDELYAMWSRFRPGVRVVVLSDTCHSGTMTKAMFLNPAPFLPHLETRVRASTGPNLRQSSCPLTCSRRFTRRRHSPENPTQRKGRRRVQCYLDFCVSG